MNRVNFIAITTTGLLISLTTGCGMNRVFYQPSQRASIYGNYRVVAAAEFGLQDPSQPQQDQDDDAETDEDRPAQDAPTTTVPYTAPGSQIQQLTLLALSVASFGTSDVSGAGREAAEASASIATSSVTGLPGLAAPQSPIADAVVSLPGLQQGFATGLGPASADRNIFTARFNPLSGTGGRCQDLAGAGFFGGSRAACESHFQR